jgi:hypothetical protein
LAKVVGELLNWKTKGNEGESREEKETEAEREKRRERERVGLQWKETKRNKRK